MHARMYVCVHTYIYIHIYVYAFVYVRAMVKTPHKGIKQGLQRVLALLKTAIYKAF